MTFADLYMLINCERRIHQKSDTIMVYEPAPCRGVFGYPLSFFRKYLKNTFWHTYSFIFSAYVVKMSDTGPSRSGHQVTSSDLTSEKV